MTLADWSKLSGVESTVRYPATKVTSVYADERTPHFPDLWRLDDYVVSSRSGPTIWLVPNIRQGGGLGPLAPDAPSASDSHHIGLKTSDFRKQLETLQKFLANRDQNEVLRFQLTPGQTSSAITYTIGKDGVMRFHPADARCFIDAP